MIAAHFIVASPRHLVPLDVGTAWTYRARVRWTVENSAETREATITWHSAVLRSGRSQRGTVAVVSGFPDELAWYSPGQRPGYTVVTETPSGFFIKKVDSVSEANAIFDKDGVSDLGEQLLTIPVHLDDCIGDDPDRRCCMYCWHVEDNISYQHQLGWRIVYRSNPDHSVIELVPGVGVTRYTYEHHGTVASADVTLLAINRPRK